MKSDRGSQVEKQRRGEKEGGKTEKMAEGSQQQFGGFDTDKLKTVFKCKS